MSPQQQWQSLVWQQYGQKLQAMLRSKVNNPADAEDLLQEILLKTYQQLGSLKDANKLKPWLTSIARNSVIDFYRQRGRQPDLEHEALWYEADQEDLLAAMSDCVAPFVDALPQDTAALIKAVDLQGKPQKDLAKQQGLSYSGLKSRVQRGRKQLRTLFEGCCQLELDHRGQPMGCGDGPTSCGCD